MRTNVSFKSRRHITYSCKYHVVWCPQVRRRLLRDGVDTRLKEIIRQTVTALQAVFPRLKSRLPSLWTHSCFVCTVGGAPLEIVKQYIENQKYG